MARYIGVRKGSMGLSFRVGFEADGTPTPGQFPFFEQILGPFTSVEEYEAALEGREIQRKEAA